VNYRSFDLSVFFAFQYGNKVYNHTASLAKVAAPVKPRV
jgi:hypothetical protein